MARKYTHITSAQLERKIQNAVENVNLGENPVRARKNGTRSRLNEVFRRFAHATAEYAGSSWAFLIAVGLVLLWALSGPIFHYSDTWQLTINTGTTIVTFLIVFLIQNTQNRDAVAIHLKLDELIRAVKGARNHLIDLEELSDEELEELHREFHRIHEFCEVRKKKKMPAKPKPDAQGRTP